MWRWRMHARQTRWQTTQVATFSSVSVPRIGRLREKYLSSLLGLDRKHSSAMKRSITQTLLEPLTTLWTKPNRWWLSVAMRSASTNPGSSSSGSLFTTHFERTQTAKYTVDYVGDNKC